MKRILLAVFVFLAHGVCLAGAWGPGSFENDDALDWAAQCVASKGAGMIGTTLQTALTSDAIEAPDGAMVVAAAEVVAAAKGKPGKALPQELRDWLDHQPNSEIAKLAPLARKALDRVKQVDVSELRQLWDESGDRHWASLISELEGRLH